MIEVHPPLLWIGHAFDRQGHRALFDAGIDAVVDVAWEERPATLPREMLYCRVPLLDGGGNDSTRLQLAVSLVVQLLRAETKLLVACSAGMSRSPTIAAFALSVWLGETPEASLQRIAHHKAFDIKAELWRDLTAAISRSES